jgi:SOS-response transcriptional repressor LexA
VAAVLEIDATEQATLDAVLPPTPELTARQRFVLEYLVLHHMRHGAPPATRDIMEAIGSHSPNGAVCHLRVLKRHGYIEKNEQHKARGYRVLGIRWMPVREDGDARANQ